MESDPCFDKKVKKEVIIYKRVNFKKCKQSEASKSEAVEIIKELDNQVTTDITEKTAQSEKAGPILLKDYKSRAKKQTEVQKLEKNWMHKQ